MKCRAMQALHLLALEPIAETTADANSYGFRPEHSTADAAAHCFGVQSRKANAEWVLEGDIQGCFDDISHDWLIANIPMDKAILQKCSRPVMSTRINCSPATREPRKEASYPRCWPT